MIINVYIWRRIFSHIMTVLIVFGVIEYMMTSLSEFSYGLEGDYQAKEALWFILVTAPGRLYDLFPMVVLMGCLTGLGALASSSELTVLRSTGYSIPSITWKVLQPVIVIMVLVGLAGETVVPQLESYGRAYRSEKSHDNSTASTARYGFWHRDRNEFIFIGALTPNGHIEGVSRYLFNEQNRPVGVIKAERGYYQEGHWVLKRVQQVRYGDQLTRTQSDQQTWNAGFTPNLLRTLIVEPGKLSVWNLWTYISYLNKQHSDARAYELQFWKKVLKPLMTAALVLVAVSFIFGPLREVAMGTRVFSGVLVGLLIKMSENILPPVSMVYGIDPLIINALPVLICAIIGLWLLRRSG